MTADWRKLLPALLAAFALGAAFGSWAQRLGGPRHRMMPPPPAMIVARLDRELKLDPEQRRAVLELLEARRPAAEGLLKEGFEKMEELRRSVHAEVRVLLRPDQQTKLDAFTERMEARRRKRWGEPKK
ncbi:hypothetical protein EPO15_18000 [bacterium]|nr:MAG: hypothetical protein EPO15_18000 [bacterium]